MNLLSQLIMNTCLFYDSPTCVRDLHYCVRDNFKIEWFEDIRKEDEVLLPLMINYCLPEIKNEPKPIFE